MSEGVDDAALVERFPYLRIDHDSKHFYRGWLDERLLFNRCDACERFHHPPKPVCPSCWCASLTPTEVSGRGVIHLAMFLHQGPPAPGSTMRWLRILWWRSNWKSRRGSVSRVP